MFRIFIISAFLLLNFVFFLFSVTSCGLFDNQDTHTGYVRHCIRIMDWHGLYSDTPEWKARKKEFQIGRAHV